MEIVVRATVIYFALWGLTRALGKRELAEMTAFDMILLVVIGDLVQQGITTEDFSLTGAMLAVGTVAGWVLVFSYTSWRWPSARTAIEGLPIVIIQDGRLLEAAMRLERLPLYDVQEAARQEGIDDLREVKLAVAEPSGRISFIKKNSAS